MNRYLVVVRTPDKHDGAFSSVAMPQVKHVRATSAAEAAETAGVPPGGYAEVCAMEYVNRFDRAEKAPLVPRDKTTA